MRVLPRALENCKGPGKSDKKGLKINIPLRLSYVQSKTFSKLSNLNCFLAQTRNILPLGFLISFKLLRIFKKLSNQLDFSTRFLIISLASRVSPPIQMHIPNLSKIFPKFSGKIRENLKNSLKMAN